MSGFAVTSYLLFTHCILMNWRVNIVPLQKGKLEELNFILSSGGMSGYAPAFYQDEPWVEFIEVDGEGGDFREKLNSQESDTQKLLGLPMSVSHSMNMGGSSIMR